MENSSRGRYILYFSNALNSMGRWNGWMTGKSSFDVRRLCMGALFNIYCVQFCNWTRPLVWQSAITVSFTICLSRCMCFWSEILVYHSLKKHCSFFVLSTTDNLASCCVSPKRYVYNTTWFLFYFFKWPYTFQLITDINSAVT